MPAITKDYQYIQNKISSLKDKYAFLRDKPDSYIFSALCVIYSLYKDPDKVNEEDLKAIITDQAYDGGVDMLLADPLSDSYDLVMCQSKLYKTISKEEVQNALSKMANFYKDILKGNFGDVNDEVVSRFMKLNAEIGDESKIKFILYTSAAKNKINMESLQEKLMEQIPNGSNVEVVVMFAADIVNEIKETETRRPTVEAGVLQIDHEENILRYKKEAVIVNASAYSIKKLYATYRENLLSKNLRYHIRSGRKIDDAIKETINTKPELFWIMNNGITIICDEFQVDGDEVKLTNFSVINGGQTVFVLYKNTNVNASNDFYLPCKIIQSRGNNEKEKNDYSLDISIAANWQKPIKDFDLRANSFEQVLFARVMREVGIFYQTKRGETIPKEYATKYLHTDLAEVGKLGLCAIFQMPGTARNKPSVAYDEKHNFYETIFNSNQNQIANICKELLYIDYYFDTFIDNFKKEKSSSDAKDLALNAKTMCIAFVALVARYHQGNITDNDIHRLDQNTSASREIFGTLGTIQSLLPVKLYSKKYDSTLDELFRLIITNGTAMYSGAKFSNNALTATNFLKSDKSYYFILHNRWEELNIGINNLIQTLKLNSRSITPGSSS